MSSQPFCVTQIPYIVTWRISSAFPSYAKVPHLQSLSGFEGAERAHVHRLPSSRSELLTPQLQVRARIWIQFLLAFLYKKLMVQILALCDKSVSANHLHGVWYIIKLAATSRTKFALPWNSKECVGRPDVGLPMCSVLFGELVTLLPPG